MTTHSLARLTFNTRASADTAHRALTRAEDEGLDATTATALYRDLDARLTRYRALRELCRRACGLARAGDSVVLVAPVGTTADEVAGGLADEGAGRERVEVLTPSAEGWPAAYAAARQRAGAEVVS